MHLNKIFLLGHLGKDPEIKETPNGTKVVNFSLATTEKYNDKEGNKQSRTEWHNIVAWGKTAELCNSYLKKGDPAFIEGRITSRSWDDKDGNKRYTTEVVVRDVQFLKSGNGGGQQTTAPLPVEDDMPF